jgi:hypothetical protein
MMFTSPAISATSEVFPRDANGEVGKAIRIEITGGYSVAKAVPGLAPAAEESILVE